MVAAVSFHEMSTDCRIFVYPTPSSTHKITWETINNALGLRSCPNFLLPKTGCSVGRILWLRSRNYFRTTLAATLSLNGGLILTVLLPSMFLSAVPAEAFLKKRIIVSRIKKRNMVDFLMKWIRIGQAAHPQLNYKDIDNQGGFHISLVVSGKSPRPTMLLNPFKYYILSG